MSDQPAEIPVLEGQATIEDVLPARAIRCDLCGRFRKLSDVMGTGNEYEDWTVCTDCMSPAERAEFEAASWRA